MADGDLTVGGMSDLVTPPVNLTADTSGLDLTFNPATGSPSFLPNVPSYSDFQPAGGSPGTVSAPAPAVPTSGLYGTQWATPANVAAGWGNAASAAPAAAAAATPAAAAGGGGSGNWLSTTAGNIGDWIQKNPMSAIGAVAGGGMLLNEMFGSKHDAESQTMKQIGQQAAGAQGTATMLQAPLTSGILPPGAQAAVNQFQQGARAQTISSYARMGMSGSTGEADALQQVNQQTQAMKFGIANNLFSQAAGYARMASDDYANLLKFQMQQDQDFSNALSRFVSALAGGRSSGSSTSAS